MKKVFRFIVLLFLFPMLVSATEYEISETPVKIDIPNTYDVFTLDNYQGNQNLEKNDFTEADMKTVFALNNAYLYAYDAESRIEIFAEKGYYVGDFRNKKRSQIEEIMNEYISNSEDKNFKILDSFIQEINGLTFFVVEYDAAGVANIIDYVTLLNNNTYIFKFQSVNRFEEINRNEFKDIMNSVIIDVQLVPKIHYIYVVIGVVVIVILFFIVKKIINKNKCPYCKIKIDKETTFCARCGNRIK